ncbi:MAG: HEPN domain-containing protein [Candidatus Magasanikbacteria bacterium]|nr:HEPN domain-containing protein [Candidatus Magasanikbacteria bacterium]
MPSDNHETLKYWLVSAQNNWKTAEGLFGLKRYDACLFFCHLAIEKLLKGLIVYRTSQTPPYIHDLPKLAYTAGIDMDDNLEKELEIISSFSIAGRYDSEKFDFYKLCTPTYTQKHKIMCKKIYLWLKKMYPTI